MVQPLGLSATNMRAYLAWLFQSHDFDITVNVERLDHTPIRSIQTTTLDGQINVQRDDGGIRRTATFTFFDPDRSMHLDADSPWEGALFVDRMIRVRHTVNVPGVGRVTATPFVGPITRLSRDGDTIAVECQDKTVLALRGSPTVTVKKGMYAVDAIRTIMQRAAGERNFRFPSGVRTKLPKAYSTGWADEASPWTVCRTIARLLGMRLFYSCDGYCTLARLPAHAALTVTGAQLTDQVQVDYDVSNVSNYVRVEGTIAPKKKKKTKKTKKKQAETKPAKVAQQAVAAATHPMAPGRLGRNGVGRYLPTLLQGGEYKNAQAARDLAVTTLQQSLPMTSEVTFSMVPVFHLDVGDILDIRSSAGRVLLRFEEGSIPIGVNGDMSVGNLANVARGRRA